jgi:hypothetical protein
VLLNFSNMTGKNIECWTGLVWDVGTKLVY